MKAEDYFFLLLSSNLGDPERKPLSTAQLRLAAQRAPLLEKAAGEKELSLQHLLSIGLSIELSAHILALLDDTLQLKAYLEKAEKMGCSPIVRNSIRYPLILRKRLGLDSPGCLWAKGNCSLLNRPKVSLVGSRDLYSANYAFAKEVGRQAAAQGFVLVSGNARGADQAAQNACLKAGGNVISVVADELTKHAPHDNVLFLSEEEYNEPFSAPRALRRNRVIHALGEVTFVAQCTLEQGGTWSGSCQNLHHGWSPLYCFADQSAASFALERRGAVLVSAEELSDFSNFADRQIRFL